MKRALLFLLLFLGIFLVGSNEAESNMGNCYGYRVEIRDNYSQEPWYDCWSACFGEENILCADSWQTCMILEFNHLGQSSKWLALSFEYPIMFSGTGDDKRIHGEGIAAGEGLYIYWLRGSRDDECLFPKSE